jgi:hypothetical protein
MGNVTSLRSARHPDRRRHRVFVTHNSEYHCRDGVCVAVRDRATGAFISDHHAIGLRLSAGIRFTRDGGIASAHDPKEVELGEQLCLSSGKLDDPRNIITSPLARVERPQKDVVESYEPSTFDKP